MLFLFLHVCVCVRVRACFHGTFRFRWLDCCQELVELGLPASPGNLNGVALERLKEAASDEVKRRLVFLPAQMQEIFWNHLAKPLKAS